MRKAFASFRRINPVQWRFCWINCLHKSSVTASKSEAWLLALVQKPMLADAAKLEDLPGNDAAPQSAKARLAHAMGQAYSAKQRGEWLDQDRVDLSYLGGLPSFASFHQQLTAALAQVSIASSTHN
jgi:hypothetical protein